MKLRDDTVYDRDHVALRVVARAATDQYRGMSADAQAQIHERWTDEVQRQIDREIVRFETRIATVLSAIGLFVAITVIWDVPTTLTVSAAILVGALTGLVWNAADVGRFGALVSAIPGYLLLRAIGPSQNPFAMFFGVVAMAAFATLLGVLRELREGDARPSGLARRLRRALSRGHDDASRLLADRGAPAPVPTDAQQGVRPGGPAAQQGGDGDRPASWTEWDFGAGDEES